MLKIAGVVVLVLIVLGVGIAIGYNWPRTSVTADFTTQRITIQGQNQEVVASKSELEQTFSLAVPGQTNSSPESQTLTSAPTLYYVNKFGCTCEELDPETMLKKWQGDLNCSDGQPAPAPGTLISVQCPAPNTLLYFTVTR